MSAEEALELFSRLLDEEEELDETAFQQLAQEFPHLREELQALKSGWRDVEALCGDLRERIGVEVDPELAGHVQERLEQLRVRGTPEQLYPRKGVIGEGGMATVFRAWDDRFRRSLALKVARHPSKGGDPGDTLASARFLAEAEVTGQLEHPCIVPIYDLGVDSEGQIFFTMRLVDGKDLREVYRELREGRGNWSQTRIVQILLKVCEAVAFANSKGVIHRDLKPANVMVGKFGEAYVLDWGLARAPARGDLFDLRPAAHSRSDELQSRKTSDGTVLGTPCYMPPEQARGRLDLLSARSDVYSIGAMLYELLSGSPPYLRADRSASQIIAAILAGPPEPLRREDGPAELVAICEQAMQRDPALRYANPGELAEDLQAYLEARVVTAYRTGAWAEFQNWIRRNRMAAGAWTFAIVALVAGLVTVGLVQARANEQLSRANEAEATARATAEEEAEHARLRTNQLKRVKDFFSGMLLLENAFVHSEHLGAHVSDLRAGRAFDDELSVREVVERSAARIGDSLEEDPLVRAEIMVTLGSVLLQQQRLDRAVEMFAQARELFLGEKGPLYLDTVQATRQLASALIQAGRANEAARLLTPEWLDQIRRLDLEDARQVEGYVDALQSAGELFYTLGQNEEALEIAREAWTTARDRLGEGHRLTRTNGANYAVILNALGRAGEARAVQRGVLQSFVAAGLREHPEALRVELGLAIGAYEQRELEEAEERGVAVLTRVLHRLGPAHPDALRCIELLAEVQRLQGRPTAALSLLHERVESEDADPSVRLQDQLNLGIYLSGAGPEVEAEAALRAADALRRAHPPENPEVAYLVLRNLARVCARLRSTDAIPIAEELLELAEKEFGPSHPHTLGAYQSLGVSYHAAGRSDEAEELFLLAIEVGEAEWGPVYDAVNLVRYTYGTMLYADQRPEESADQFLSVIAHTDPGDPLQQYARDALQRLPEGLRSPR